MNTDPTEPRCAECHMWDMRQTHPYRPAHFPKCSQATVHDLRFWLNEANEDKARMFRKLCHLIKDANMWQSKYRVVKHENNQLRKKLDPQKKP